MSKVKLKSIDAVKKNDKILKWVEYEYEPFTPFTPFTDLVEAICLFCSKVKRKLFRGK